MLNANTFIDTKFNCLTTAYAAQTFKNKSLEMRAGRSISIEPTTSGEI
jgi:hypothetical protein